MIASHASINTPINSPTESSIESPISSPIESLESLRATSGQSKRSKENFPFSELLHLFFDSIGRREECRFYLQKFRSERSACFSLLCPDSLVCQEATESLVSAVLFLLRLELIPALLLTGPQAGLACSFLQRRPEFQGRYRLFRPDRREESLEELLSLSLLNASRRAYSEKRALLILWPQILLREAIKRCSSLSERIYLIRLTGGIKAPLKTPCEGIRLYYYFNPKEIEQAGDELTDGDLPLLHLAHSIHRSLPKIHLSVTSPFQLLKEIFTVKGAGTILRLRSKILSGSSPEQIAIPELANLLKRSFGRELRSYDFLKRASAFYIEESYQGAIVMERHSAGSYLSKFAVGTNARGIGIADELWSFMAARHPALFWRSRPGNFINRWYAHKASGLYRTPQWEIFWIGIETDSIAEVIEFCQKRPVDFL